MARKCSVSYGTFGAMTRTREENHLGVTLRYKSTQVGIDETKPWARAPMTEQPALDMLGLQGLPQRGIRLKMDHAQTREIAGAAVDIHPVRFIGG